MQGCIAVMSIPVVPAGIDFIMSVIMLMARPPLVRSAGAPAPHDATPRAPGPTRGRPTLPDCGA
jgi:hypothetical protein